MSNLKLTGSEEEFVSEMRYEYADGGEWHNFDPDFRQKDIMRLIRRGWFERRIEDGSREYRWTEAGRAALAQHERSQTEG